jgi:hypothetical protein
MSQSWFRCIFAVGESKWAATLDQQIDWMAQSSLEIVLLVVARQ